jgi:diaminopimelate epimerase
MIAFAKMHGCGNDFVVVRESDIGRFDGDPARDPAWRLDPSDLARRVCDRRFGIGADGLLAYGARPVAADGHEHVRMHYWNADGGRAEMCGNGARCVVRLAWERGDCGLHPVLDTDAGPRPAHVRDDNGAISIEIDMGRAIWEPESVPVRAPAPMVLVPLQVAGVELQVSAVSMGNPHAVVFVPDRDALMQVPLSDWGPALATHALFPRGANADFATASASDLHLRVWERGSGATLACGTATCATLAAARRAGFLSQPRARVHQPGGTVEVWEAGDGHLWLAGPAVHVADGVLVPAWLAGAATATPPVRHPAS